MRAFANERGIFIDQQAIKQTYRALALLEPEALATLMKRYRLSEDALNAVAPYLSLLIKRDKDVVTAMLRGDLHAPVIHGTPPFDSSRLGSSYPASARRAVRRHLDRDVPTGSNRLGGVAVVKKVSRAEAQRLAKQFREQAKSFPPIPDSVTDFVDNYVPIGVEPERWERVASVVRDEVKRAGFQSVAAVVRHCTTFGLYMAWRDSQGLSLDVADVMKLEAIDKYGDRTKNDYRSRLRTLASRVAPDVGVQVPSLGYNAVRQGYTLVEEAAIRRVSLGQPRPETRRRVCAVVGLSGGGGLDAQDLRWLLVDHIDVRDDGIHVDVHGPKARRLSFDESTNHSCSRGLEVSRPATR